ncbi:MAG TPA: acyl-CoA carboxylase subunit epsilon [Trebonia sp.]
MSASPVADLSPGEPYIRVVRGDATAEEIAALVATLTAVAAARSRMAEDAKQEPVRSNWSAQSRLLRAPVHPAAGAWRRSALP